MNSELGTTIPTLIDEPSTETYHPQSKEWYYSHRDGGSTRDEETGTCVLATGV